MQDLQVFQSSEFGELGVLIIEGREYFPATACAKILGYKNPRDVILKQCKEDGVVKRDVIDALGRTQQMKYITEGNLYRLIVGSKLPAAERFERWIFDEVLPTLRRQGYYGSPSTPDIQAIITQAVTAAVTETVKQLLPLLSAPTHRRPAPSTDTDISFCSIIDNRCKLERFPAELVERVDSMLEDMTRQQTLNFSLIARFCTLNGHPISSPAVKTYFTRRFNQED